MSAIPLHLQRRFEQRWASRFALKNVGTKATTSKSTGRCAVAAKTQEKIRQGESATIVNLTAPIAVAILHMMAARPDVRRAPYEIGPRETGA
jgi:hypothetical protein